MHINRVIPFRFRMAQRQNRLVRQKSQFFDFDSLPWQRHLKNQKKLDAVSNPLHQSTNPEILAKIAALVSELRGLESRPLKKNKKKFRKNIGKIYSPFGNLAERAK